MPTDQDLLDAAIACNNAGAELDFNEGQESYEKAIAFYNEAAVLIPNNPYVYRERAKIYWKWSNILQEDDPQKIEILTLVRKDLNQALLYKEKLLPGMSEEENEKSRQLVKEIKTDVNITLGEEVIEPSTQPIPQQPKKGYIRYVTDNDCGYLDIFGLERTKALNLLIKNGNLGAIQNLIRAAVEAALLTESFFNYLQGKQFFGENSVLTHKTILDSSGLRKQYAENPRIHLEYYYYDIRDKGVDSGWAHPAILQSLAHTLGIELHIWYLGENQILLPNRSYQKDYDYSVYIPPKVGGRIDLLFISNNHFELLAFFGYEILPMDSSPQDPIYPLDPSDLPDPYKQKPSYAFLDKIQLNSLPATSLPLDMEDYMGKRVAPVVETENNTQLVLNKTASFISEGHLEGVLGDYFSDEKKAVEFVSHLANADDIKTSSRRLHAVTFSDKEAQLKFIMQLNLVFRELEKKVNQEEALANSCDDRLSSDNFNLDALAYVVYGEYQAKLQEVKVQQKHIEQQFIRCQIELQKAVSDHSPEIVVLKEQEIKLLKSKLAKTALLMKHFESAMQKKSKERGLVANAVSKKLSEISTTLEDKCRKGAIYKDSLSKLKLRYTKQQELLSQKEANLVKEMSLSKKQFEQRKSTMLDLWQQKITSLKQQLFDKISWNIEPLDYPEKEDIIKLNIQLEEKYCCDISFLPLFEPVMLSTGYRMSLESAEKLFKVQVELILTGEKMNIDRVESLVHLKYTAINFKLMDDSESSIKVVSLEQALSLYKDNGTPLRAVFFDKEILELRSLFGEFTSSAEELLLLRNEDIDEVTTLKVPLRLIELRKNPLKIKLMRTEETMEIIREDQINEIKKQYQNPFCPFTRGSVTTITTDKDYRETVRSLLKQKLPEAYEKATIQGKLSAEQLFQLGKKELDCQYSFSFDIDAVCKFFSACIQKEPSYKDQIIDTLHPPLVADKSLTAVHVAAEQGAVNALRIMHNWGVDLSIIDIDKDCSNNKKRVHPLHLAAKKNRLKVIGLYAILNYYMTPVDDHSYSPAWYAIQHGHYDALELLHKLGSNPLKLDYHGNLPIYNLVLHNCITDQYFIKVLRFYKDLDISLVSYDYDKDDLHNLLYLFRERKEVVEFLLNEGISIEKLNRSLKWVIHHGEIDTFKVLHTVGANLSYKDPSSGYTLAHQAAEYGRNNILAYLLDNAVKIVPDNEGNTLAHVACEANQRDTIEFLFSRKLQCTEVNHKGKRPWELASYLDMKQFFVQVGIISQPELSAFERESSVRNQLLTFKEKLSGKPSLDTIVQIIEQLLAMVRDTPTPTMQVILCSWIIGSKILIHLVELKQYSLLTKLFEASLYNPSDRAPEEHQNLLAVKALEVFKSDEEQFKYFLEIGLDLRNLARVACQNDIDLFIKLSTQTDAIGLKEDYSREINWFSQRGDTGWLEAFANAGLEMTKAFQGDYPWNMSETAKEFFRQKGFIDQSNKIVKSCLPKQKITSGSDNETEATPGNFKPKLLLFHKATSQPSSLSTESESKKYEHDNKLKEQLLCRLVGT